MNQKTRMSEGETKNLEHTTSKFHILMTEEKVKIPKNGYRLNLVILNQFLNGCKHTQSGKERFILKQYCLQQRAQTFYSNQQKELR